MRRREVGGLLLLGNRLLRLLLTAALLLAGVKASGQEPIGDAHLRRRLTSVASGGPHAEPAGGVSSSFPACHLRPAARKLPEVPAAGGPEGHQNRSSALPGAETPQPPLVCPGGPGSPPLNGAALSRRGFYRVPDEDDSPGAASTKGCWRRGPCLCASSILGGDWRENCADRFHAEDWTDIDEAAAGAGAGGDEAAAKEARAAALQAHENGLRALAPLLAGRRTVFIGDSVTHQFYIFLRRGRAAAPAARPFPEKHKETCLPRQQRRCAAFNSFLPRASSLLISFLQPA